MNALVTTVQGKKLGMRYSLDPIRSFDREVMVALGCAARRFSLFRLKFAAVAHHHDAKMCDRFKLVCVYSCFQVQELIATSVNEKVITAVYFAG